MMDHFDKMRVEDEGVCDGFCMALASQTRDAQADVRAQRAELQRQESLIVAQQDRLLNLPLADDMDQDIFARKSTEIRDRLAAIKVQIDALDRSHDEAAEEATRASRCRPDARSRSTTPSSLPNASVEPSGENATLPCPARAARTR
jgi:hypothetical protein